MRETKLTRQFKNGESSTVFESPDPRFVYVALTDTKSHIVCKLDTGVIYELPIESISVSDDYDGTPPVSVTTIQNGEAAIVRLKSGVEIDFPADFVLHHCEPAYEYYAGKPAASSNVGKNVRHWRQIRLLTLADLSKKTGIAEPNLSRLEHGKHSPSLNTIQTVAQALGVTASELISGNHERRSKTVARAKKNASIRRVPIRANPADKRPRAVY
ncbi:MAG TPA: helix-turn-helix transcriptional regulator [Planctomycetota bacterium]|nr:helix-turn-helix transcriptional regulator [Planctomycetota bacterium]